MRHSGLLSLRAYYLYLVVLGLSLRGCQIKRVVEQYAGLNAGMYSLKKT